MRLTFLLLILLAAPAVLAQDQSEARRVLDACIEKLGADDMGLDDLDAACPGLKASLEQLGVMPLLPEAQRNLLMRGGLKNLRALLDRYAQSPEREDISVEDVQSVLDSLREPAEVGRPPTWYERFKRWLSEAFDKQERQNNPWLQRWFDQHPVSEAMRLGLFYGVVLLVVVLAVIIVVNEIRNARAGRRKRRAASLAADLDGVLVSGLSNFDAAGGERPAALLRLLIATLVKTGRLHGAQSLTPGELTTRAHFDDTSQRESFQRVAQLAEREVFSGKDLASDDVDDAVRAARSLNTQLGGAAT